MGCTSSTAAGGGSSSGVKLSDMGSRKGVGHTERMGRGGSRADRRGIGHTERMGRGDKGAAQADTADLPAPELDLVCDGEGECAPSSPDLDDAGVMTEREVARRTSCSARTKTVELSGDGDSIIKVRYAFWTQRGYYPDDPDKANQDSYSITHSFGGIDGDSLFAVYDGHGRFGHDCADFAKRHLPKIQAKSIRAERIRLHKANMKREERAKAPGSPKTKGAFNPKLWPMLGPKAYEDACRKSLLECNKAMHRDANVDDTLSGTTVISASFHDGRLTICNVGDSRAVLGVKLKKESVLASASADSDEEKREISEHDVAAERRREELVASITGMDDGALLALPLSQDQTPYRPDERERVKACGARVMTVDQIEGLEPVHEDWGKRSGEDIDEVGDPPRIWRKEEDFPGTAFSRSLGDIVAKDLGVTADPEMVSVQISRNDRMLILASDGVFEFLTNQQVVEICSGFEDPLEACRKVVSEAYKQWLHYELRTDDISIIVLFLDATKETSADDYKKLLSMAGRQGKKPIKNKASEGVEADSRKTSGERSNSMYDAMDAEAIAAAVSAEIEE